MNRLPLFSLAALLSFSVAAHAANDYIQFEPKDGPGKDKHIVFLSGDEEYRSEESMPMLAKLFNEHYGFKSTVLFSLAEDGTIDPKNGASLSHPEALDTADAIVMLTRFRHWPAEVEKHFTDALARGIPVVGLRTSTHAFNDAALGKWGKQVLGEGWVNHWGKHKHEATRGVLEPSAQGNPVLNGVTDLFVTTDVYEAYPASDAKILVRGQVLTGMTPTDSPADYSKKRSTDKQEQGINNPMMPIAWTREVPNASGKTNRILCTTMGASTDLQNESLRRMVVNAVFWGLGMDVPAKADVTIVGEYHPSMYGFDGFKKGVKPADLQK